MKLDEEKELTEQDKQPEKFDPAKSVLKDGLLNATPQELYWRDIYLQHGNASAACKVAFPDRNWSASYTKLKAWELKKKFGFGKKKWADLAEVGRSNKGRVIQTSENIISYVKQKYTAGEINEEELFAQMRHLAYRSPSDDTKYKAVRELKLWVREIKSEIEAHKLMEKDIIDLLASALIELPKVKYMKLLKSVRLARNKSNWERSIIYNADEVRKEELDRLASVGGKH